MLYLFTKRSKEEIELADQLRCLKSIKVTERGEVSISSDEIYSQRKENTASMLGSFPTVDAM